MSATVTSTADDPQQTYYVPFHPLSTFERNPLTTTFSPPPDCSGVYSFDFIFRANQDPTCFPDGFDVNSKSFFSPGYICPNGYTQACHDSDGVSTITTVTCCPVLEGDVTLGCVNTVSLYNIWTSLFCTWAPISNTAIPVTLSENGPTSTSPVPFTSPQGINAYGIRMVYQETDIQSTAVSEGTGTTIEPAATQPTSSGVSTDMGSASNNDVGLSTGSKVAIGVSIPIAVISVMSALLFLWLMRLRRNKETARDAANQDGGAGGWDGGAYAQDPVKLAYGYAQVLPYGPPTELEQPRPELHSQTRPVELPGRT